MLEEGLVQVSPSSIADRPSVIRASKLPKHWMKRLEISSAKHVDQVDPETAQQSHT